MLMLSASRGLLNIISHTDLDGVTAAALAWHANAAGDPVKISLTGYGEVDNLVLEALRKRERMIVLDLSPQFQATVDEIDRVFPEEEPPFFFDHHQSTYEKFSNRRWIVVDMSCCGAAVYWNWLTNNAAPDVLRRVQPLGDMVRLANDRDLWINENPDGRLWQAMVTLCGEWGALTRLITNPGASFTKSERETVNRFVAAQEERFVRAREHIVRKRIGDGTMSEMAFLGDGHLDFGDTSDFCGALLDRPEPTENVPALVALACRRPGGNWAVSLRSRNGLAGRAVALLKDGRRVRGGGHGDAAALYFPGHYKEADIRDSILAALTAHGENSSETGVTLGDFLKGITR
jgi:hypothetical protein